MTIKTEHSIPGSTAAAVDWLWGSSPMARIKSNCADDSNDNGILTGVVRALKIDPSLKN